MALELDLERALERVGGDAELLKELGQLFLDDYPSLIEKIASGLQAGDLVTVERTAHNLKGAVGNFGAQGCWEAASRLERLGRDGQREGLHAVFDELRERLAALHGQLVDFVRS